MHKIKRLVSFPRSKFQEVNRKALIALCAVTALLVPLLPFEMDLFLHILILIMLYQILALGLNIVPGFTGLLDLGYVGFYGIGAYTAGLLTLKFSGQPAPLGILGSFWAIIPLAAANGAFWGILRGAPTLKLTGDYFAIVTFGFSELVVLLITNETWLTRGPMGLPGIAPLSIFGFPLLGKRPIYYVVFVLLCATLFLILRLADSRIGRAWFAIREDEVAAQCCGINVAAYKLLAFAISAAVGAVGGSFFARWLQFISPNMFKFWESIVILCMIVLGGMGSITGTMLGAAMLIALSEILRAVLPSSMMGARYLFFGLILIVIMRYKPDGLVPIGKSAKLR